MDVNCGTDPEVRVSAANACPVPEIEFLPAASAVDARIVATVTGLINSVYKTSEDGLWIEGALRTAHDRVGDE